MATVSMEDIDYRLHRWSVRLSMLRFIGNAGVHPTGERYTYVALDLGPLYYYPSMLSQAFMRGETDDLYDDMQAMRTTAHHHISLMYLPPMSAFELQGVLASMQERLQDWLEYRFEPEERIERFVQQRHVLVRDVPFTHGEAYEGGGTYSSLRNASPQLLRRLYFERLIADTWTFVDGQYVETEPVTGLPELMSISRRNRARMDEAEAIVAMTQSLPYLSVPNPGGEWLAWMPCYLDGTPTYRLEQPSELAELIYFSMLIWSHTHPLQIHHAIFNGLRTDSFKVQSLDELHVTPVRNAVGEVDGRFCIPRLEVALGLL